VKTTTVNSVVIPKVAITHTLKQLVPLIQTELEAGLSAGLEHYRRAGEYLLEAKAQMGYGNWGKWLKQNFVLSQDTAQDYMRLARTPVSEHLSGSLRAAIGAPTGRQTHAHSSWRPVLKAARELDAELFAKERQAEAEEIRLHRELAVELVNLGYRALATRLHPDRGGSKDAMVRLHRVRDALKSVAETRRFL
jgi:Protein of unknown function (DUF3102)